MLECFCNFLNIWEIIIIARIIAIFKIEDVFCRRNFVSEVIFVEFIKMKQEVTRPNWRNVATATANGSRWPNDDSQIYLPLAKEEEKSSLKVRRSGQLVSLCLLNVTDRKISESSFLFCFFPDILHQLRLSSSLCISTAKSHLFTVKNNPCFRYSISTPGLGVKSKQRESVFSCFFLR